MAHAFSSADLVDFGDIAAGQYVSLPYLEMRDFKLTFYTSEGAMLDGSGQIFIKPCTEAEAIFYDSVRDHPNLAQVMPTYMGRLSVATKEERDGLKHLDPMSISAALQVREGTAEQVVRCEADAIRTPEPMPATQTPHGPRIDTSMAVMLDNIAAGFLRPNVLDVKLGTRLYADDAPEAKRVRLTEVSQQTTSGSLGLRISGMRVWQRNSAEGTQDSNTAAGEYKLYGKLYGRKFNSTNVQEGFEAFFCSATSPDNRSLDKDRRVVVEFCENELAKMEEAVSEEESRMYSSSILFVFEGDDGALSHALDEQEAQQAAREEPGDHDADGSTKAVVEGENDEGSNSSTSEAASREPGLIARVKLIDFAHAQWTPGMGPDTNVLQGIRNTRAILRRILDKE